ncbi:coiled-coil domain-containing protein 39-like isoform X1 [Hylaeus anthracinus]|uniref:coiled-coil domain-containing protein 39-like isoform X1 n=1 Tax=Hylaeus anthracinus TaxID=313031 RepID=UPI0023BA0579|nr:coiled-coil domain-containing protein 39-like isoform X1 [Hylaeus anthracinus]
MAMNNNIDTILSELGWNDGFRIPIANEENRKLEEEIERKMKLKKSLSAKLESTEERLRMMKNRISNLKVERDINQKLLTTHSTQLETENHHYRLSCNTETSLRREARDFEKEWKKVNEAVSGVMKELEKLTKKIESSKKVVEYDEQSLRELEEKLNQNENNNQLIEQYMKEDAKEYKELELRRQKLSTELQTYQEAIIKRTNEAKEMEIILDRTSRLYDQALADYRQMFNQWKESVIMLQQRNNDIKNVLRVRHKTSHYFIYCYINYYFIPRITRNYSMQNTETLRETLENEKSVLEESENFLKEQTENNKQAEQSIKVLEKKLFDMREEQCKLKETFDVYENQLAIQKNVAKELTQRVEQVRVDTKRKETETRIKYAKIEKLEKQVIELTGKLEAIDSQKLNIEEKAKELESIIEEHEKKKVALIKEVNQLQAANLRITNETKQLENESKVLKTQYENECKKSEHLDKLYAKHEKELEEKKQRLYQVEFEVQKAVMKLDRLRGHEQDKGEAERKQQKIEELQSTLNEKMDMSKLLQKQIASLEHDMRKISNSMASNKNQLEYLRNKRQDLVLLMDAGEKRLKSAQNRFEEKQVEESILRLKVSQMEKMVSNLGDNVYDLKRYRLELEAAIRERKAEISVQKDSLVVQKRVAANECSELRNAISERKIRIKQLQTRYENGAAILGTKEDGTPINTTHLKIQNAQERYLLQEQGDKLDETIRKAEHEIQAMENTLRVINVCNDKYKTTLTEDEQDKDKVEEHRKLDRELQNARQSLKEKQDEFRSLTNDLQRMQNDYAQILKDIDEARETKENKDQYLTELKQQIHDQEEKISRADKNLRNAQKDIQQMFLTTGNETVLIQEKEVELREIQEQNSIVLQDIAEFTINHVEAEAYIKKLLAAKNIELPPVPLPDQSSTSSQCPSTKRSVDHLPKTYRKTVAVTSRESIGNIVNIEPEFQTISTKASVRSIVRHEQKSVKVQK